MITPTVGRIVWYYPPGRSPAEQPQAAIITHVHSDICVNLAIFDDNGMPDHQPPTSIPLIQDDQDVPAGGNYCTWMPYQRGQAAKTEAVEKKLAEAATKELGEKTKAGDFKAGLKPH